MTVYETCYKSGKRLEKLDKLQGVKENAVNVLDAYGDKFFFISLDNSQKFGSFSGFGGAFTEAAAYNLNNLSPEKQDEIIEAYFGKDGLGYTFGRTHINSSDFSLGNYDYVEENDTSLNSFNIERERKYVLPFIHKAIKKSKQPLTFFSSPWSPPAWMKTTGTMNHGGSLKDEYREVWAEYYCRYIKEMKKEGIDIWGLTVQNEPEAVQTWDSCIYTAEQERDFVKLFLGPALEKNGLGHVKIIVHDHNRDHLFERAKVILDDPEAAAYVWGAGFHWYDGDNYQNLEYFKSRYPDKQLVFTEGCQEQGTHHGSLALGERYGTSILNDLARDTTAWIDWNMILNLTGGPNHVYNMCSAPILVDTVNDKVFYESSYYYIGHFSRFIQPGAKRIFCSVSNENVLAVGFENPGGQIVAVMLNTSEWDRQGYITIGGVQYSSMLKAHSIQTLVL